MILSNNIHPPLLPVLIDRQNLLPKTAVKLYTCVKALPIYDYHCHLSAEEIYKDEPFENIGKLWLEHDHYKWRLMRSFGIDEERITGGADWREKFLAFSQAIAYAAGNPLYHWTAMELSAYFGIDLPLNPENAELIWNTKLQPADVQVLLSPQQTPNAASAAATPR